MPVVSLAGASPYPFTQDILNLARVRVNDTMNVSAGLVGDLLSNSTPATAVMLNAAWQWLQAKWSQAGGEPFVKEAYILSFPVRASNDVFAQCYLGAMQSSDGVNVYANQFLLPLDLIYPQKIERRVSGIITAPVNTMQQATSGLPRYLDCNVYDWRQNDGLYFYGDITPQDFIIRYVAAYPSLNIADPLDQPRIIRCENCLAARIAYEFVSQRDAPAAVKLQAMAEEEFQTILQRTSRRKQRANYRRQPYSRGYYNNLTPIIR